jgi:predicted acylesterase/phospholipase RssA
MEGFARRVGKVKRVATIAALIGLGVYAGREAGPGPFTFMARLELAGDAATFEALRLAQGLSVDALRAALKWDLLFLVCYGLTAALATSALGRWLGGSWEAVGAGASFAALLAAALDAAENAALLHVLEGRGGARLAQLAAGTKFGLLAAVAAFLVAALAAAAWKLATRTPTPPLAPAEETAPVYKDLSCDVVMKGGITSGVVYPRAVARLADEYRFVNVGGASAGAIAAGLSAAAEYARSAGRTGFAVLADLPRWLGADGNLFKRFKPNAFLRGPFDVFVAFLGRVPVAFKLARAFAVAAVSFPLALALGLLPGALLAQASFAAAAPAWGVTGAVVVSLIAVPLMLIVGLVVTIRVALPRNGYGLCSGHIQGEFALSSWLASLLEELCGIQGRPVLFADLWTAGEKFAGFDDMLGSATRRSPRERRINFEALTTSLSHGRPYRFPEPERTFYFQPEDLRSVLPEHVVTWMKDHPGEKKDEDRGKLPAGLLRLPAPAALPVVFAIRTSLSFPFLLSAVKLWSRDRSENCRANAPAEPHWLSDGGIASNFPIHFFDALAPSRPTFGLDLAALPSGVEPKANEADNVFLATNDEDGFREAWTRFDGVTGFVGALVNAIQAFLDNMQARAPGFRDRIARIELSGDEGGLNLTMPSEVVERLGLRGKAAGDKIVERFIQAQPSGWDEHRWIRMRTLVGTLDPQLRRLAEVLTETPVPSSSPVCPWPENGKHAEVASELVDTLVAMGKRLEGSRTDLTEAQPTPVSVLRGSPRV